MEQLHNRDRETAAVTANNSRRKTENVCVSNI